MQSDFQAKLESTLKTDPAKDLIQDIFRLHLFKNAEKSESLLTLVEVYDLVGFDRFVDLINVFDGLTITFPSKEDLKETVQLAIAYYYRNIQGKTWAETKEAMRMDDLPTIKYGIRITQLQTFLEYFAQRMKDRTHE